MSWKSVNATTGERGNRLVAGFDFSNLKPQPSGEGPRDLWERDVSYRGEATLAEVLKSDKWISFDLLANIMKKDEKVKPSTEVSLYSSGHVKEIRVKKKCYRIYGKKYLGTQSLK